jgi:hypothetical protein
VDQVIKIVQGQAADSCFSGIPPESALVGMVERGFADSDACRTISDEETKRRFRRWQTTLLSG